MGAVIKQALAWLLASVPVLWFAYVIHGWITYSGAWKWLAEWELRQFGSYGEKGTFIALVCGPLLVSIAPLLFLRKLVSPPGVVAGAIARPASVATASNPATMGRVLAVISLGAAVIGAAAGWIGYEKSQQPQVFEAIDLARGGVPRTRHAEVSGVAQTGSIVVLIKTFNGNRTEETYIPLTKPDWRAGDPVSFFLLPHGNVYAGADGARFYDSHTRPFPLVERGTVFSAGLPGLVRTEYERRQVVLAPETFVLDTKVDADLDVYFGIAFAGGLTAVLCPVFWAMLRLRNRQRRTV